MPEEWSFLKKFTNRIWPDFVPKITTSFCCIMHETWQPNLLQDNCRIWLYNSFPKTRHPTRYTRGETYLSQIRSEFHLNPANVRNGKRYNVFPPVMGSLCESIERILSRGNIYLYPVLATMPLLTHWVNNIYTPGSHVHRVYGYQIKFEYLASYTVFVVVGAVLKHLFDGKYTEYRLFMH